MLKSRTVSRLVSGNPVVVIQNGTVQQQNMKALRMSIEELFEQLRQKDVFSLSDVAYAIVETNGSLSVIKYPAADYLRPKDMGIIPEDLGPDFVVVSDGQTSDAALKLSGKDKAWLLNFLKKEEVIHTSLYKELMLYKLTKKKILFI